MGMLKIDHIRAMLAVPRVSILWRDKIGRPFDEQDVKDLYAEFEPALLDTLSKYSDPIREVVEAVKILRKQGLRIGSTTGYTQSMMDIVVPNALSKGYDPDFYITPDGTNSLGRPYPYMIFRNMEALKLSASWKVVKVGDTVADIKEGLNAGVWTVGVIIGSSEMGLSLDEFNVLSKEDQETVITKTDRTFLNSGADFTIKSMSELPLIIERINNLLSDEKRPYARSL